MEKYLLTSMLLFILSAANAQFKITGKIISADNKKPIASASVFFSNTSKGSTTNDVGEFIIENMADGRYDLVASCIGYETYVQQVIPSTISAALTIELKPKIAELDEVVVGGYTKEGWKTWGKFFMDNFIGQTPYAAKCTIKNTEAIQFRNYKKQHLIKAFSDETLVIENKSLGYILRYRLELFQFDFVSRILFYQGYPLFEKMETSRSRKTNRWAENREKAYYGSELHFMRSLFRNKLVTDGFEIRKQLKVANKEKQRVKALYASRRFIKKIDHTVSVHTRDLFSDSSAYYENILRQPDEKDIVFPELLPSDSIAYAVNKTTAGLDFSDYLRITYTKSIEESDYLFQFHLERKPMAPVSLITLNNKKPVEILANGLYYNSMDLLTTGYWAWSEKIANMLPFDYWPEKKQ